ncbi:MAG: arylsulfatase A [Kiritimatiellia bacterium]|jgi:arylsulfatase A
MRTFATRFLGLFRSLGQADAATSSPNILLIFADHIGYEALGGYGGQDFQTPRLDRMAEEGLRFTRAYTSPVCTPSGVSMYLTLKAER